jgi:sugar-specific transcriptional regulator TrmB
MSLRFENIFKEIGLSQNESLVFLALTALGPAPASQVAKASKVKRSTTYFVLEQLVERGIVVASRGGKTDIYRALEPQRVVDFYSRKLEYLRDAVPALEQLRRVEVQFPSHEIFKDADARRKLLDIAASAQGEALAWINPLNLQRSKFDSLYGKIFATLQKRRSFVRLLAPNLPALRSFIEQDPVSYRSTRLLPMELFPQETDTFLIDTWIITILPKASAAIVENSEPLSSSRRSTFDASWELAELRRKMPDKGGA